MKKKSVERRLKRYFQDQTEYLPTLAVEGVTNHRRAYSARRMQKPLLIALTAYLAISIAVVAWVAVRYMDEVEPAATTTHDPNVTEEPAFEIRRPSAEQDALFSMERITEEHQTTDYAYTGPDSFDDLIAYIDNPVFKPFIVRVSITGEETGVSAYITEVHCRIEEIYYAPAKMNLQIGGTNITITEKRGVENGKMWYYKGDLPTLDCYDYYLIGYFKDVQEQYDFDLIWEPIPVVDCYEQYEETMNYYGFDIMDIASIYSNGVPRLKNFIAGSKQWFENEDNLRILKDRLAEEDENDLY